MIESVLKGNYLIKSGWRKEMNEYYDQSFKSGSTPGQSIKDPNEIGDSINNGVFV